jgi:hypothetical protein
METEHYKNMKSTSDVAISLAVKNNQPIDIVGASPILCDLSLENHPIMPMVNFIDVDLDVLNSISELTSGYPRFKFIHQDVTGLNIKVKKVFIEIYRNNADPENAIRLIIDQCNNFDFQSDYCFGGKVLLSLNVISELQPPIRQYVENLHTFYFNNFIKYTINKNLYVEFEKANNRLYDKYVVAHLKLSKNYDLSNYIVSIYEGHNSYIDPVDCSLPSDHQSQMFVEKYVDLIGKPMFWDWKISKTRIIRIMQFYVKN